MNLNNTKVTIIITTKNEEEVIEDLLKSIKLQTYNNIETIIVDNQSTDQTLTIAKKYSSSIYTKGPERSAQRNLGAMKSSGSILIFLDADMVLEPDVVSSCVEVLDNPMFCAVVIPERSIGKGYWAECKILERTFYLGIPWIESARCFRKTVVQELKGYDESMSGPEDFDLPQRVKETYGSNSVGRISTFIIHNEGALQFWELLKRKYYYGRSMRQYIAKSSNRSHALAQGNLIKRYLLFLSKPALLLKNPLISIGMIVLKTCELISLALGTLIGNK